nr:protein rep [Pseudonocardia sp. C8]
MDRVRKCCRVGVSEHGGPVLRLSGATGERVAGYAGLARCGSPHACPTCAPRIGASRAQEIAHVVAAAHGEGGSAALLTLTLRHRKGQALADLWDAVTYAWGRVTSGKAYQAERERFGITGWVRATEVTYGEAGWHPHAHVLIFFDTPMSPDMVRALGESLWPRWERAVTRRGYSAVEHRGGLDVRVVNPGSAGLGEYLQKVAMEAVGAPWKRGRDGSRTPFQILDDLVYEGHGDDLDLWTEWEVGSQGRKALTWANGTRERYRLAPERSDQELADEEVGTADDDLIALPAETWRAMRDVAPELLDAAETGGMFAAAHWLNTRGLSWLPAARVVRPPVWRGVSAG